MNTNATNLSRTVKIINEFGLHARPAAMIGRLAEQARSGVKLRKDGETVDAGCVLDMLSLACAKGTVITLLVEDAEDIPVLNAISELIANGFKE